MNWVAVITAVGVVIAFFALVVGFGFFNSAKIIQVRFSENDNVCPFTVYGTFRVMFVNRGNADTTLHVNVWSNEINFSKNSDDLYMSLGRETPFNLNIDTKSLPGYREEMNITIYYNWFYNKNFFQLENHTNICSYVKKEYETNLILTS